MASNEILWVVHVRAKREPNARRVLHRVVAAIGSGWLVLGPHSTDGEDWTFEMICAADANGRLRVPGVEWAHVQLATRPAVGVHTE